MDSLINVTVLSVVSVQAQHTSFVAHFAEQNSVLHLITTSPQRQRLVDKFQCCVKLVSAKDQGMIECELICLPAQTQSNLNRYKLTDALSESEHDNSHNDSHTQVAQTQEIKRYKRPQWP